MNSSTKNDGGSKKFLFDAHDFDKTGPSPDDPVYTEEQLVVAKTQSFESGKTEGLQEATQSQQEATLKCLQRTITLLEQLVLAEDRRELEQMAQTVRLTARVTAKLLPQFAEKFAIDEIERVIVDAVEARREEPRIAITVPTAHLEKMKTDIDALALEKGYAGKVIVIADDNLAPTDVRVEWADGGAERIFERIYAQIETEFAKAIDAIESTGKKADN